MFCCVILYLTFESEITESLDESRRPPIVREEGPAPRLLVLQSPRTPRSLCIKPRPARDTSHSPPGAGGAVGPAFLFADGAGLGSYDSPAMPAPTGPGIKAAMEREKPLPPPPLPEPPKTLDSIVISHLREQVGSSIRTQAAPRKNFRVCTVTFSSLQLTPCCSTGIALTPPAYARPCRSSKHTLALNR
jgi:hypothetical protein